MATATNVSGSVQFQSSFTEVVSTGVVTPLNLPAAINQNLQYANGTGALQCDYIYAKALSLAGTATTLDLTSLTDLAGGAVNFARVRELIVVNTSTTATYTLTVTGGASNPWSTGPIAASSSVVIQPNVGGTSNGFAMMRFSDPYSTGASTGYYVSGTSKTLKLDPGANTFTAYVLILGCSAVS